MAHDYQFGDVEVDPACFTVYRAGRALALEPKAVTLLLFLIEHRARVVSKDELVDLLWKDTFVTPNALTRLVAQLRRELGDDAQEPRYIQTVHRRGYRFIAPLIVPGHDSHTTPQPVQVEAQRWWRVWGARAAVAIVVMLLAAIGVRLIIKRLTVPHTVAAIVWSGAAPIQVTASLGLDKDPALSPDGQSLAWSSDASGRFEIYVKRLGDGEQGRQLTSDGQQNVEPAWSPDRRWLAYRSHARRGIWVVPVSGGSPRQVSTFGSQPAWSPDGRRIAFGALVNVMAARTEIWTVRPDGTDLRPLTRSGAPEGAHQSPAFSADGNRLAFTAGGPGVRTVWVQDLHSSTLTEVRRGHLFTGLAFSRDGDSLWWGDVPRSGTARLLRQALDPQTSTPLGEPVEAEAGHSSVVAGLSIVGHQVAWVSARTAMNLWSLPLAEGRPAGPPRPLTRTTYRNTYPTFSPDGSRIAFQLKRPGADTEVWTVPSGGGEATPIGPRPRGYFPHWTPDGSRVLAVVRTSSTEQFSYLDPASGRADVVRAIGAEQHPRLSPDGTLVAYHAPSGGALQVFVAPVGGGAPRQITFGTSDVAYPAWSRDGRQLAVEVRAGEDIHIAVLPASGGPMRMVTSGRGLHWPHSWAPDNDHVAFAGERDNEWNLYSVSTRTGQVRQLTEFGVANGYVRYPAWSPRGTSIVFERAEARGNIWTRRLP